ncbi:hypothetical protein ABFV99_14850 [Cytobacillus horneckiae]|uniref:hypothetical protein n=1 Tax=Cytobacillus horneckiae TaxID=549687 RepID=UPI0034CF1DBB
MKRLFAIGLFTIFLAACSSNEIVTISPEEFNKLKEGMTTKEVEEVIGGKSDNIEKIDGTKAENHIYKGDNGVTDDSEVILYFSNGKLEVLTEIGLISEETTPEENKKNQEEAAEGFITLAEQNAIEYPAEPGSILYDKNEEKFKGMQYYFKGELIKTESVDGLFNNPSGALIVKNEEGYIMPIFPPYEIEVAEGDQIEAWGPLSGDGYSSSDLGVDNVVGIAGAINAVQIDINGERQ